MWLHYKIENKKTGPRRLLWWSNVSFAGEFPQILTEKI
jgi:hypothetical protein